MNELFDLPFDPSLARLAMYAGALLINIATVSLFTAILIRFILKPGVARVSARRCLIMGLIFLSIGFACMAPQIANMRSMTNAIKNIRS